jgi:ribosome-associated protein
VDLTVRKTLALRAAQIALEKKAGDVVIMDLKGLSSIADFFVICSGGSDVHVKAISKHIEDSLLEESKGEEKVKPWHIEGHDTLRWVLLDYVHVIVHVFREETRDYYGLERLWGDAKMERVEDLPAGDRNA